MAVTGKRDVLAGSFSSSHHRSRSRLIYLKMELHEGLSEAEIKRPRPKLEDTKCLIRTYVSLVDVSVRRLACFSVDG